MFRFNIVGGVMLGIGALVGGTLSALGVAPRWAGSIGVGVMLVADLLYRWRQRAPGVNPWLGAGYGGFLAIAPAWLMGVVLIVAAQFGLLD
jgi:uncharacterized membrane protein YphA (DoxX/SURF4 family)